MAPSASELGGSKSARKIIGGIWVPTVTFYTDDDEIDVEATGKHAVRLAQAGITAMVPLGSYGEGVLVSSEERSIVTSATRKALDAAGFEHVPVISGVAEQSVKNAVAEAKKAAAAGADAILCVCTSYYRAAINDDVIKSYFTGVADGSPIPVFVYNYPGVVAGIDISSETLIELAQHPNIIGTKFTCGNSGKLGRVAKATKAVGPASGLSGEEPVVADKEYFCVCGMADFLVQGLSVGAGACICGPANITPKTVVKVYELFKAGKYLEAFAAQQKLTESDYILTALGPEGTKQVLKEVFGYGGNAHARRPLPNWAEGQVQAKLADKKIKNYLEQENAM
ncbi:uncharacterized protein V1516DRAFT_665949 [Lipomyces oligophaga]|uniref:uncharacterized protein n=1 Tax=Lipomyces oligophaga TaxID=45792 RepID=UPI0034CD2F32